MSFELVTTGNCPRCGQENSLRVTTCKHCEHRLPWADELEGIVRPPRKKPSLEQKWEALLVRLKLLPKMDCRCRYCDRVVDVDAVRCPYCKLYLSAHDPSLGPR